MAEPTRVSTRHVSIVLGVRWRAARKILTKLAMIYPPDEDGAYDARILDVARAMRNQPHRALEPVELDWLARYLKETSAPKGQST